MVTEIIRKSIIILVGVFLVVFALRIFFRSKNVNPTERKQIWKTAGYVNAWLLLGCFMITLLYGVFHHVDMKKSVRAVISLNYSEASQALNSNGTRYNMAEIIGDEVVERAIEKGALEDVTSKQLKECLQVYPSMQGNANDESKYLISTEYTVEYRASKDTEHLDSENVVSLITTAYKEYYIENYTDNFRREVSKPNFEEMEYMDIVSYLDKETQAVLDYLYGMAAKNPSFTTQDKSTFDSIAGKVYQFKETQINENLRSLILQNGIVRNKQKYIDRLAYQNKNIDFDRKKNNVSYKLCNEAVDMYSEEMTRIVLVPTWDKTGKYYMGRTKVGVDELSIMATTFSDYVASNEKEIMDNELVIDKISAGKQTAKTKAAADALIESIYESVLEFTNEAITAGREYSRHKMNQCVTVSIYGTSLLSELKALILFAIYAYAMLLLHRVAKKFPKKA